ncbi:asparagine synthase-related protein [Heliorestis convoluta]|uniref:asparagine synthase (glutamine-hydrolyzing) n=1 Tax=Heliorestis convoluta TaxID=356322 RepID=A0A5Q2MXH5_9FIRM|nr:asparagine synthase-related protein [Heliorestis convoluta]QGG47308.1 Putative asparagine synthase [Heliorestis convoluta]
MNLKNVKSFLQYGYFMNYEKDDLPLEFSKIDKLIYTSLEENELVNLGIEKFIEAISKDFEYNYQHVVPLSGGLDSRAILAALLEFTDASNIFTYTFGTPGTLDYEIGGLIAKKAGTKHTNLPLTTHKYCQDELIDISNRINNQTMLFHHPPVWLVDELFSNHVVWSGYIGDLIVGGHLPTHPVTNLKDAKLKYLNKYKYVKSLSLSNIENDFLIDYINFNTIDKKLVTYEEQILFNERVRKLTAPHVLIKGYNYKTPFINNGFMDFMLSLDNRFRLGKYLFIEMMLKAFPKLFSQKTKNNYGLPLKSGNIKIEVKKIENKIKSFLGRSLNGFVNPYINYLDFRNGIREREDLLSIFSSNIMDLKSRGIIDWIDIEDILNRHLKKQGNFADALIVLTSLEIHLKAQTGWKTK